jgi:DNA-directed RNA polymerase II subunit RPB1
MPTALNKEEGDDFCSKKDTTLIIQRGELFAGYLNGKYVKNSANGLIHIIWKDLGPQACCDFLSEAQYIVNNWLVTTSFTIGVQDIVPKPEITAQVRDIIQKAEYASRKTIHVT